MFQEQLCFLRAVCRPQPALEGSLDHQIWVPLDPEEREVDPSELRLGEGPEGKERAQESASTLIHRGLGECDVETQSLDLISATFARHGCAVTVLHRARLACHNGSHLTGSPQANAEAPSELLDREDSIIEVDLRTLPNEIHPPLRTERA